MVLACLKWMSACMNQCRWMIGSSNLWVRSVLSEDIVMSTILSMIQATYSTTLWACQLASVSHFRLSVITLISIAENDVGKKSRCFLWCFQQPQRDLCDDWTLWGEGRSNQVYQLGTSLDACVGVKAHRSVSDGEKTQIAEAEPWECCARQRLLWWRCHCGWDMSRNRVLYNVALCFIVYFSRLTQITS